MDRSITLFDSKISIADDQSNLLPPCTHQKPDNFLNSNEYSRYILCCLTTTYHDNLAFYKFPSKFKIYKGDAIYRQNYSKPEGKMFFYFNAENASADGFIHEFTLKTPIEVIALDRVSNIEVLMASALADSQIAVFDALTNNFQLDKGENKKTSIVRHRNQMNDYLILNYLCSLGF